MGDPNQFRHGVIDRPDPHKIEDRVKLLAQIEMDAQLEELRQKQARGPCPAYTNYKQTADMSTNFFHLAKNVNKKSCYFFQKCKQTADLILKCKLDMGRVPQSRSTIRTVGFCQNQIWTAKSMKRNILHPKLHPRYYNVFTVFMAVLLCIYFVYKVHDKSPEVQDGVPVIQGGEDKDPEVRKRRDHVKNVS